MKKDDTVYLKHILDAISKIEDYTERVDYDSFVKNTLVQDGVIRQIEIIGEATKRLSGKFREKYSHIEWKKIAGMRDKLIHNYLGVDIDGVWDVLKTDIPLLRGEIENIIEKETCR
jgi:uncharacterized protein with HEPN domain